MIKSFGPDLRESRERFNCFRAQSSELVHAKWTELVLALPYDPLVGLEDERGLAFAL